MTFKFDETLTLTRLEEDVYEGQTDGTYWNLIGPYGGWIAAVMLKSVLVDNDSGFEPLVVSVEFMKAPPEGSFIVRRQCDRAGRTASFWRSELEAPDGKTCVRAMITLAPHRDTLDFSKDTIPDVPKAEEVPVLDGSRMPIKWPARYETRYISGQLGQKQEDSRSLSWIRDIEKRPLDHVSLTAISDSPFPRLFLVTGSMSNISTISLTTYLHAGNQELNKVGDAPILVEAVCERSAGGFYDQHSKFYSPQGRLIATSKQMVWYDRAPGS